MRKLEFNGKVIVDFDDLDDRIDEKIQGDGVITKIEIVTDYPQVQEQGVLYIKVESSGN